MADDNVPDVYRVLNSMASAKDQTKQLKIFARFVGDNDLKALTTMVNDIGDKALENMVHAKAFLLLLNYQKLYKTIGKKNFDQFMFASKKSDKLKGMEDLLGRIKKTKSKRVPMLQAKVGMFIQLMFLLRERIIEEGMPPMKVNILDETEKLLDRLTDEMKMVVILEDYGKGYWNLLVELLKEADFRTKDKLKYELVLTERMVRTYSTGEHLAGSAKGEAGQSALSDVMITRMGRNIVKRMGLLLRTVKMYQGSDHPSVQLGLESLHGTVSEVLEHRPSVTFTRIGSDLLIDDVKNRKKEKFIDDFVVQLDERNVNSITVTAGVSPEELRVLMSVFTMTTSQVKKAGGAKKILDKGGVTNVLVDQFKYGIISADEPEGGEQVTGDEKMIENIIFTELTSRLKEGKGLGDLNSEDVGAAFKQLVSGAFRKDKSAKSTLAQMLLSIDPDLAERALFSKEGFRDDIQWSSARRMIDELLVAIPKGSPEERISTLENLSKMAEIAMAKNKDTTLTVIIEKIIERLRLRERDLEVAQKVVDTLADICKELIVNGTYGHALEILRNMFQVKNRCAHLPAEKKDELCHAMPEVIDRGMKAISEPDVIDVLVRDLETDSLESVDRIVRILETMNTETVVTKLLNGFLHESRSVRNRCFQALNSIGEKTLEVTTWKLRSLDDHGQFPRMDDGTLEDDAYYIARNCVDLMAKLGKDMHIQLLKDLADDKDPRIRREVMVSLASIEPEEGAFLARLRLTDQDILVAKAAISTLGKVRADGSQGDLIDLFFAKPELRESIINALGNIGGKEAEDLLINATKLRMGGSAVKVFTGEPELRKPAIQALGQCAGQTGRTALRKFIGKMKNPLLRAMIFPMKQLGSLKEMQKVTQDALARTDFRLKKK